MKPRQVGLKAIAVAAVLAVSCSKPIDYAKLTATARDVDKKAWMALARCDIYKEFKDSPVSLPSLKPCDRIEFDPAFRELEDTVLHDSRLKAAVAEYGNAFELAFSSSKRPS
jgi:hypothetical protein